MQLFSATAVRRCVSEWPGLVVTSRRTHRSTMSASFIFCSRADAVKSARAMAALDAVNARFGSGTLRPAATGMIKTWAGRQARHSPRYTTRAEEMLVAKAF